jgi:hypothetical protein
MASPASPEVLLLELVLAGIDEGIIQTEADLARLYTWLTLRANAADRRPGHTSRRTSARDRPARAAGHPRRTGSAPA